MCLLTQWHDERDKGETDREITRWDEETGVIMDLKRQREIITTPWHRYLRLRARQRKVLNRLYLVEEKKRVGGCRGQRRRSGKRKLAMWVV